LIDSLNDQYNVQLDKTVRTENKAKSYLDRYNQLTKGVNKLENNKNYKTGDNLLNSLGDKLK
jgi:hypothetical protein